MIDAIPKISNISYEISYLPIEEIFQSTKLLITSASSVALEAVCCRIYVVIIGNRSGPTINRLSGYVDKRYWSICYSASEIMTLIDKNFSKEEIDIKKYFQPVDMESTLKMMTFKNNE